MLRSLLLIALVVLTANCGTQPKTTERTGRSITLTDSILTTGGSDTIRFGRMRSGEIAVMQLWLANDASRATALLGYERNCGCTTLEFDNQPIAPTDAQRISLTFDSRGTQGWQLKLLELTLAGVEKPFRVIVEANVE